MGKPVTKQIALSELKPNPGNPRFIRDEPYQKLVQSIKEFPEMLEIRPLIANQDMVVLAGNMRLKACQEIGLDKVPVMIVDLTPEQERELIIKDNLSYGEFDWDLLVEKWDVDLLGDWGIDIGEMGMFNINGVDPPELKDGDQGDYRQITFTLHKAQKDIVEQATGQAKQGGHSKSALNENSNGNAIAWICERFCDG